MVWDDITHLESQDMAHVILSVLPRLNLSIAQWESNSQPKDDPYALSLQNSQVQYAKGVNTLGRLFTTSMDTRRILTPGVLTGDKYVKASQVNWIMKNILTQKKIFSKRSIMEYEF